MPGLVGDVNDANNGMTWLLAPKRAYTQPLVIEVDER